MEPRIYILEKIYKISAATNGISSGFPSHYITALFNLLSVFSGVSTFAISNAPNASLGFPCCAVRIITSSLCSSPAVSVPALMSTNHRAVPRGAAPFYTPRSITH